MKKLTLFLALALSSMNVFSAQSLAQMNVSLVITPSPCETRQIANQNSINIKTTCDSAVAILDNDINQNSKEINISSMDKKNHRVTIMY